MIGGDLCFTALLQFKTLLLIARLAKVKKFLAGGGVPLASLALNGVAPVQGFNF